MPEPLDVVTGAFGFTGKYLTRRLLAGGRRVRTLTGHPERENPFGEQVEVAPYRFDDRGALAESLRGAETLYNTYWVRFTHGGVTYDQAVENTKVLFAAAKEAGVRRVVHVSITQPSEDSPLPYFRGKAVLERALRESGLSHAILRPAVLFGPEDILINNIAWMLRRFPLFAVPGDGQYRVQPMYVDDMAALAVDAAGREGDLTLDAVGPETFTFDDLVRAIGEAIGRQARLMHVPPSLMYTFSVGMGALVGDVVLTRDEIEGLMDDLLVSDRPPTGTTRLTDWLRENASDVGMRYHSELTRHYR